MTILRNSNGATVEINDLQATALAALRRLGRLDSEQVGRAIGISTDGAGKVCSALYRRGLIGRAPKSRAGTYVWWFPLETPEWSP